MVWTAEERRQNCSYDIMDVWSTIILGLAVRYLDTCPCDTKQSSHITTTNKTLIAGAGCRILEIMTEIQYFHTIDHIIMQF